MSSTAHIDVERYLSNLEKEINRENADTIRDFIDHCAAQGLSEVRQQRNAQSLKNLLKNFAVDEFQLHGATEDELKPIIASLNRSDYADSTKHTIKSAVKKFYKVQNGGQEQPEKTKFFSVKTGKPTTVTREELFTTSELKELFASVNSTRDRAMLMVFYETAARPDELLSLNIGNFTSNENGDFISLKGSKDTPDRTNQLVRSGRPLREWIAQHPVGGEVGDIQQPGAPLWVKTEQQACRKCGKIPHNHENGCDYEPDETDRVNYAGFYRRFKSACQRAGIPENKDRPYNIRHTRLTEVAKFMAYEQLNKFAGWVPGSDRAKIYVHLTSDDVNQAIREEYGLRGTGDEEKTRTCVFCGAKNQSEYSECRQCGRALEIQTEATREHKFSMLERLEELEKKGVFEKLENIDDSELNSNSNQSQANQNVAEA